MTQLNDLRIIRKATVLERLAISNSNLYRKIEDGLLTQPISLGLRAVGWPEHEINAILALMVQGKSKEEIQAEVKALTEQRANINQLFNKQAA